MDLSVGEDLDASARAVDRDGFIEVTDQSRLDDRRIIAARRRLQAIAKALADPVHSDGIGMDRTETALLVDIAAQNIDAVQMIGMRLRVTPGCATATPAGDPLRADTQA